MGLWFQDGVVMAHVMSCLLLQGLEFVRRGDGRDTLVSVGEDRRLIEYDLNNSSVEQGLW